MSYTVETLNALKRPELQALAKANGIKANLKSVDIIAQLLTKLVDESQSQSPTKSVSPAVAAPMTAAVTAPVAVAVTIAEVPAVAPTSAPTTAPAVVMEPQTPKQERAPFVSGNTSTTKGYSFGNFAARLSMVLSPIVKAIDPRPSIEAIPMPDLLPELPAAMVQHALPTPAVAPSAPVVVAPSAPVVVAPTVSVPKVLAPAHTKVVKPAKAKESSVSVKPKSAVAPVASHVAPLAKKEAPVVHVPIKKVLAPKNVVSTNTVLSTVNTNTNVVLKPTVAAVKRTADKDIATIYREKKMRKMDKENDAAKDTPRFMSPTKASLTKKTPGSTTLGLKA